MLFTLWFPFCLTVCIAKIPFSWDTVPTFAFPGAHVGFLTDTEIKSANLAAFQQIIIWGFNVSCQSPTTGKITPAKTRDGYSCPNNTFYPNMESSLRYQAKQLKTKLNSKPTIFAYIIMSSSQESYKYQHEFNSKNHSKWHLTIKESGTINCFDPKYHCEYQGPSHFEYDFRQIKVQNFFIQNILMSLTNDSSPLDGIFLDEGDVVAYDWCQNRWNCSQREVWEVGNASVQTIDRMLDTYKASQTPNKIFSISIKANLFADAHLYWAFRRVLEKHSDVAIRYFEFFAENLAQKFLTFVNETNYGTGGLPIHVHVDKKTMNPDWVELAAFLVGMNDQSWFSYSRGWTIEQHWYQKEFGYRLGAPLAQGKCSERNNTTTNVVCMRKFEHCDVNLDLGSMSALIVWL